MSELLKVKNLKTCFRTRKGVVRAVDDVSFSVEEGQVFGLVGESGAGKSVTGFSIINLIDPPGRVEGGQILLAGQDILRMSRRKLVAIRGRQAAMIFQDPQTSLNPVLTIRRQMFEALSFHQKGLGAAELKSRSLDMLRQVGIPAPEERLSAYPHHLSGGMKQRVVIAMALLNNPKLLIADEPTTALDVTIQAQILLLMKRLCREFGSALILITHDIAVVAQMCNRVGVMYGGRIVEMGSKDQVIHDPLHPYTRGLIQSLPKLEQSQGRLQQIKGEMPSLLKLPQGCHFRPRCPQAGDDCLAYPPQREVEGGLVSCHRVK